jgi:isoleucyl-tRNA synthetase
VIATLLFDRPAYRACVTNGLVLDEGGRKMSKSKGNALEPMSMLARFGADAIRWTFLSVDYTEPMRIGEETIRKAAARTLGTLTNVVAFHLGNARADGLAPVENLPASPALLDRWLLSRLETTRTEIDRALDVHDFGGAARSVGTFVDDLSTWYLRRSRPRFWADASTDDRKAAHATLSYTLLGFGRAIAPLLPYTAESIFQEVGERGYRDRESSVHRSPWPVALAPHDPAIELAMDELRALVEVGRELRHRAGVRSRIPLAELVLFGAPSPALASLGSEGLELLADELNVKRVRRVPASDRGNFGDDDWVVREDEGTPVAALPRNPTPELAEEGLVREVARRLQQTRKEMGLRYTEKVSVTISAAGSLFRALETRREPLASDLLAEPLELTENALPESPDVREWDLDGVTFSARMVRRP